YFLADRFLDIPPASAPIVGMDPLEDGFPARRFRLWIEAVNPVAFVRSIDIPLARHVVSPAPRVTQPLRFCQIRFALPKSLSRALPLADVARKRQVKKLATLFERAGADLDGKCRAVLAPVARLEGNDFPGAGALRKALNRRFVQRHIEFAGLHADELFAPPAEALARLSVGIHDSELLRPPPKNAQH